MRSSIVKTNTPTCYANDIQTYRASDDKIFIALYDYNGQNKNDLSFKKGDQFFLLDNTQGRWLKAQLLRTKEEGFAPDNYIAPYNCYFGSIGRKEAERLLKNSGCGRGTYLIRDSVSGGSRLSISVFDEDQSGDVVVKHYRIKNLETGEYYIEGLTRYWTNLQDLVEHYTKNKVGLRYRLTRPCPRPTTAKLRVEKDIWEISREQFQFLEKMNTGTFCKVWKGQWQNTTNVAIKTMIFGTISPESFLQEANTMKILRHEKLVAVLGVIYDEPSSIIMEFMVNGNLLDYLINGLGRISKLNDQIDMATQVAAGLVYIERMEYVHKAVRASNVFVGAHQTCKIGDFSLTQPLEERSNMMDLEWGDAIKWAAPEAALHCRFSNKSDVWSFGILMTEILTKGKIPYPGMKDEEVLDRVRSGYRMARPQECPERLYDLICLCWDKYYTLRPTFENVHEFLDNYFNDMDYVDL